MKVATNKSFKSRHATKSALKKSQKGKMNKSKNKQQHAASVKSKIKSQERKQKSHQILVDQNTARKATSQTNKNMDKIVAIVPLCHDVDASEVKSLLAASFGEDSEHRGENYIYTPKYKQHFRILDLAPDFMSVLDGCKIADIICFVLSAKEEVTDERENWVTAIISQGIGSTVTVVQHLDEVQPKKHNDIKRSLLSWINHFVPNEEKVYELSKHSSNSPLIRHLTTLNVKSPVWRQIRPYVTTDSISFPKEVVGEVEGERICLSGFVRGANLDVNRLVHILDVGDFQIEKIITGTGPLDASSTLNTPPTVTYPTEEQDDLQSENIVDDMMNEQTWPTDEDIRLGEERMKKMNRNIETKLVPKGTSSYQAAWILDERDDDNQDQEDEGAAEMTDSFFHTEQHEMQNEDDEDEEEKEEVALSDHQFDDDEEDRDSEDSEDESVDSDQLMMEREQARRQDKMDAEVETEFPDEMDTPRNIAARIRFQRYRGVKSLRTSTWDPEENLPRDYGRIFRAKNYKRLAATVMKQIKQHEGIQVGKYVTLYLKNVSQETIDQLKSRVSSVPLTLFGLLPHEHKMSVLHFQVQKNSEYKDALKSKTPLTIHLPFRRFTTTPIYSTVDSGALHKFERFLPPSGTCMMSCYGPFIFGSSPVFLTHPDTPQQIETQTVVASGTFHSVDPYRIMLKRIILSAHPHKIHKRETVAKYMFWNPEDIHWFKPVELRTKYGRSGYITESVGTHGHMKVEFDGPLKQQDTICMYLYKRVYPKWNFTIGKQLQKENEDNVVEDRDVVME